MPYSLSEKQIDFILNDIRESGVTIEKLQINLLDHICCIMEEEMKEGENFESMYQSIKKQVFEDSFTDIEEETNNLLRFKHYYKMKRILYTILFLSMSYNVLMLSRFGYEYYKQKQRFSEWRLTEKVTLKDGYQELEEQLKEKYPEALTKDYLCISFVGDPMTTEDREEWNDFMDSAQIRLSKIYTFNKLKSLDSIAGIYNKHTSHVFAFKRSDEEVNKFIDEYKSKFKNVLFINGQKKLFSGYFNDKKQSSGFMQAYFIVDKSGKLIYDCSIIDKHHIALAKFLKTLPN